MKGPLSVFIAAFAVAGVAQAGVAPPPPGETALYLNAGCAGDTLVVTVDVVPVVDDVIVGGQFFLEYDTNELAFVDMTPGDPFPGSIPENPFELQIYEAHPGDDGVGTIDYIVGAGFDQVGTNQPTTMAIIYFDIVDADECDVLTDLVKFRTHDPANYVTDDQGTDIVPGLNNLDPVIVDTQDPTITNFSLTEGDPCQYLVSFEVDIKDNCCLGPFKVNVPEVDCADSGNVSFTPTPITGGWHLSGTVAFSNVTCEDCEIEIEILAWDCCGRMNSESRFLILEDDTPPVVTVEAPTLDTNREFHINAEAGKCKATVELDASATDNCDGTVASENISFIHDVNKNGQDDGEPVLCSDPPCSFEFDQGETWILAKAVDSCGTAGYSDLFKVIVSDKNEMLLELELDAVFETSLTRCIHFEFFECPDDITPAATADIDITFSNPSGPGTGSNFVGQVLIPCGNYTCITAQDPYHTLRRMRDAAPWFEIVGTQYKADFMDADPANDKPLLGGEYNAFDDVNEYVDVLDFGVFFGQFQANKCFNSSCAGNPDGCTPCGEDFGQENGHAADGSGDGCVDLEDFTFIEINALKSNEDCECNPGFANAPGNGGPENDGPTDSHPGPVWQIRVADLVANGLGDLAVGDINGDGWLDVADIIYFKVAYLLNLPLEEPKAPVIRKTPKAANSGPQF